MSVGNTQGTFFDPWAVPLVGRDAVLTTCREAVSSQVGCLMVAGERMVGTTRVAFELMRGLRPPASESCGPKAEATIQRFGSAAPSQPRACETSEEAYPHCSRCSSGTAMRMHRSICGRGSSAKRRVSWCALVVDPELLRGCVSLRCQTTTSNLLYVRRRPRSMANVSPRLSHSATGCLRRPRRRLVGCACVARRWGVRPRRSWDRRSAPRARCIRSDGCIRLARTRGGWTARPRATVVITPKGRPERALGARDRDHAMCAGWADKCQRCAAARTE